MLGNFDLVLSDLEKDHLDLSFHASGIDQCKKGNLYGPRTRRYHLIHFVLSGVGTLMIDSDIYPVKPGQAFYIPAGVCASYKADVDDPWKYCGIGYRGTQAHKYSNLLFPASYVLDIQDIGIYERKIMELLSYTDSHVHREDVFDYQTFPDHNFSDAKTFPEHLLLNGKLKELFAVLLSESGQDFVVLNNADYADKAKHFIEMHYDEAIQIADIASYLNLNPRYLTTLFKKKFKITPKKYLTYFRIEKAKVFLIDTDQPLQVIANAIGFENSFSFSRLFKSVTGISPANYREQYSIK